MAVSTLTSISTPATSNTSSEVSTSLPDGQCATRALRGLRHYRDIAIVRLMLLRGPRSREVLGLACADVSLGERTVRVPGKGATERMAPMAELGARAIEQYLALERPRCCESTALFVCLQLTDHCSRGRDSANGSTVRSVDRSRVRK